MSDAHSNTSGDPSYLVVGAGITGMSAALLLARRGCDVVLLFDRFGERKRGQQPIEEFSERAARLTGLPGCS